MALLSSAVGLHRLGGGRFLPVGRQTVSPHTRLHDSFHDRGFVITQELLSARLDYPVSCTGKRHGDRRYQCVAPKLAQPVETVSPV